MSQEKIESLILQAIRAAIKAGSTELKNTLDDPRTTHQDFSDAVTYVDDRYINALLSEVRTYLTSSVMGELMRTHGREVILLARAKADDEAKQMTTVIPLNRSNQKGN